MPGQFEMAQDLGADAVHDITQDEWPELPRDAVDVVLDASGRTQGNLDTDELFHRTVPVMAKCGTYVTINTPFVKLCDEMGWLQGSAQGLAELTRRKLRARLDHGVAYQWAIFSASGSVLADLSAAVDSGAFRVPDVVQYDVSHAEQAFQHVEQGKAGKSVLAFVAE